jgi:hypothetical protein
MVCAGLLDFRRWPFKVHQINEPYPGKLKSGATIAAIGLVCGLLWMPDCALAAPTQPALAIASHRLDASQKSPMLIAADPNAEPPEKEDGADDDKDVPTSQVDKYISVYEAMQKDHNLTVEQAASKQGLTVAQFRSLENKIENDDTLRERVRKALRHAANPADKESSDDD